MWVDIQQNSDEWFGLRIKKATSSNFSKIMAFEDKPFGEPAKKYAEEIAVEIVTGIKEEKDSYKNNNMDNGHIFEPIAVNYYEKETFLDASNGGFFYSECQRFGDSPDRNIGKDGCLEVKSVIRTTQFERLKKGGFDTAYKWQIHGHIWLGEKEWCDFVSFCPSMPENKKLYIYRVEKDIEMIERLKHRLNYFWESEVKKNIEILLN